MTKRFLFLVFIFSGLFATAQTNHFIPILPHPNVLEVTRTTTGLNRGVTIVGDTTLFEAKLFLSEVLADNNVKSWFTPIKGNYLNGLPIVMKIDSTLKSEFYILDISEKEINLTSGDYKGMIWAIQSFHQVILFSKEMISGQPSIPGLHIEDQPAFVHRGMLLDCCRHFFSVETVKKYIDLLSFYKMNVLHWHLTEDQGWRIEIDAYPKLTEKGAWRIEEDGSRYGGFYTKTEIRDIVVYAEMRGVTVIPEIELPGHSQAALAAYPEFSCSGEDIEVINDWGVFKEIYCAGNDSTFLFLETILDEVMELFPSKYIHIGGDEAPKFRWEHCDKCQKRMTEEELEDEQALQSYFIKRIEQHLNANDRILIGWDEILEGGLAPDAVVQNWRGQEFALEAARTQHQVIMSPTSHCYLDYGLDAIDLEKIYSFNPYPEDLNPQLNQYIIGGECNMWTEWVPNNTVLDQKVFPRMIGMASALWEGEAKQPFGDFYKDLQFHYPILTDFGVQYGLEGIPANMNVIRENGKSFISLSPGVPGLHLKYTYGNSGKVDYSQPFPIDKSAPLKIESFKNGVPYGESVFDVITYHDALGKSVKYNLNYSPYYTASGDFGLVDGLTGSLNFRDGHWQGFDSVDVDIIIDLEKKQKVQTVSANFYQYNNAWIFFPTNVEVFLSKDGAKWMSLGSVQTDISEKERGKHIFSAILENPKKKKVRYIRFKAKNIGAVPDWHEAAGSDSWIFIDEIIIE